MNTRTGATGALVQWVAGLDTVNLALQLTLLDLMLRPIGNWAIRPVVLILAAAGLLFPRFRRQPVLWGGLAALAALRVLLDWPLADNHAYLLCYWCLALALSLAADDTEKCVAFNGRLLIGLVFGFAVLWKLALSPDFMNGTFFQVTMLMDPRFEDWTTILTGLSGADLDAQQAALTRHFDAPQTPIPEGPPLPVGFVAVAQVATLWMVAIEMSLLLAFWWWSPAGLGRARDALLLLFCATIYVVAPVEGFGWLLIAMGVAQCDRDRVVTRALYLAVYALILVYREVPVARLLAEAVTA